METIKYKDLSKPLKAIVICGWILLGVNAMYAIAEIILIIAFGW